MSLRDHFRTAQEPPADPSADEARAAQGLERQRGRHAIAAAPKAAKAVAGLLRPLTKAAGARKSMGLAELTRRWADIVGLPFGVTTEPVKLAAGALTLKTPRAHALMVQHSQDLLIQRLAAAGAKVESIRIVHGTLEPRGPAPANVRPLRRRLSAEDEAALAQSLDQVADPALKSALLRLGRAVKQG